MTGFRLANGGAQEYYGVVPDLCALGKTLSAGHPLGIVCGSEELMAYAEGFRRLTGDYVAMTGTYSGNPVSCAVGLAVLEQLRALGLYERVFARDRQLMSAIEDACASAGIAVRVTGEQVRSTSSSAGVLQSDQGPTPPTRSGAGAVG